MSKINRSNNICFIGAGYVGGPSAAVIALKCPQYNVYVVDVNIEKISQWNSDNLPIYEPGLNEIVNKCRGKNLYFLNDMELAIKQSYVVFISVNTPIKARGHGMGRAPDVSFLENCARSISRYASGDMIVVEKSTVPVGSAHAIKFILNTENSRNAITNLLYPDRVLVGGDHTTESGKLAINYIVNIYAMWIDPQFIITGDTWSTELSKLTANAFLAQRISSINAISILCEKTGANVKNVAEAIGADKRIGSSYLNAGIGFGGSCFKKDIMHLVYLCESLNLFEIANYWQSIITINDYQQCNFVSRIIKTMFNNVYKKKLAILGFAFKPNTTDTRNSPAINICKDFLEEGAILSIYDPKVENTTIIRYY
ncbi:hypothetical protein A3Q56_02028, partial [Intoshia linei]